MDLRRRKLVPELPEDVSLICRVRNVMALPRAESAVVIDQPMTEADSAQVLEAMDRLGAIVAKSEGEPFPDLTGEVGRHELVAAIYYAKRGMAELLPIQE